MTRMIACVVVAVVAACAVAAPVPKVSPADAVLARVTVEHVGSALSQAALRKELALTAEQEKKLAALKAEYEKALKKIAGPEVVNGPSDPTVEIERFKDLAVEVAQFDAQVILILTPAQHRRLRQMQLQKGGPTGLFNRHMLRALAPTVEQEDAMARELAKYKRVTILNEEMIAMFSMSMTVTEPTGEADQLAQATHIEATNVDVIRDFIRKEIESQEKVRQAMLKHLTAEQRATWAALTGAPLKGTELLRAGSVFGDAKVVQVMMRTTISGEVLAQPQGQPVPPPPQLPPPGAQLVPPPQLPPPVPPPGK